MNRVKTNDSLKSLMMESKTASYLLRYRNFLRGVWPSSLMAIFINQVRCFSHTFGLSWEASYAQRLGSNFGGEVKKKFTGLRLEHWIPVLEGINLLLIVFMPVLHSWWYLIPPSVLLLFSVWHKRERLARTGLPAYLVTLLVSTVFSSGFKAGVGNLADFSVWLTIAWLVGQAYSKEFIKKLLRYLVFSSFLWLGIGLSQAWAGVPTPSGWVEDSHPIMVRIYSVFINPNIYATYLLSILIMGFFLIEEEWSRWRKLIYSMVVALALASLYLTYSRTGWLVAGIFLVFWSWPRLGRWRWPFYGILLAALLVLPGVKLRFLALANSGGSLRDRLLIWKGVLHALRDFWVWGTGPDGFSRVYPWYAIRNIPSQHAHQLYLQLWLEHGIFSFAVFLLVIKKSLTGFFTVSDNYTKALMMALLAFLGCGFADTWYLNRFVGGYFWLLMGLLLSLKRKEQENL